MSAKGATVSLQAVHDALRDKGFDPTETSTGGLRARCPAHKGDRDSLTVNLGDDGKLLTKCHSKGCSHASILAALGLKRPGRRRLPERAPDRRWSYLDADGQEVGRIVRWDLPDGEKEVRPRRPDGRGGWEKREPARWPLYNLPDLLARPDAPVLVVEGEKTADRAAKLLSTVCVVTSAMGARSAGKTDWAPLTGRDCIIWPDADEAGHDYARAVALHVPGIKCVDVAGLPDGWDLADTMPEGETEDSLNERLRSAKPIEPARARIKNAYSSRGLDAALRAVGVETRFNTRAQRFEYLRGGQWEPPTDQLNSWLREQIRERCVVKSGDDWKPLDYSNEKFFDLRNALGEVNKADPFLDWLAEQPAWDKTPRLDNLLLQMFGAEDTPLARWTSRYLPLAAIQRAREPGCKLDEIPVLLGPQDCGKSSFVRRLLPDHADEWFGGYVDLSGSVKTQAEQIKGCVFVEFSEMQGVRRAELESLKAFLTRQNDAHRPAYGREKVQALRVCAMLGTTNQPESLPNDSSGNRRFVIVELAHDCNVERTLGELRGQVWAEALCRYEAGERANLPRDLKGDAAAAADAHRVRDAMEEEVREAVSDLLLDPERGVLDPERGFTMRELHEAVAGVGAKPADTLLQMRYGRALHHLGFGKRRRRRQGAQVVLWTGPPPAPTTEPF